MKMKHVIAAGLVVLVAGPAASVAGSLAARASTANVVYGTSGNDTIRGNRIQGRPAQFIYGRGGNDRIWGGKGSDTVFGGAGRDRLHSFHSSDDALNGGPGRDVCIISRDSQDSTSSCVVRYRDKQGNSK